MSVEREEQEKNQQMPPFQASFQKMNDRANLKGESAALTYINAAPAAHHRGLLDAAHYWLDEAEFST
jgi:hypothetical protein